MSVKSEGEYSDSGTYEDGTASRRSSTGRTWSSSLTRSRKGNSRIATVKPVAKCLSSSEEELSKSFSAKGSPRKDLGSTSPRIARLLSKDVTCMEKDAIVAELEKCLIELENEDTSYKPLVEEYSRIEEERDELASELENAFEELEGYMQHVKDVEAEKKNAELEKEELTKEVKNLKYCLTSRQQIEEISLRKDKECLELTVKELTTENKNMKDQISELLEERQSLIESLLNLHSSEVDDVIQTRSRSCSTVSMDSVASSSAIRNECNELRDRVQEAEEAEIKLTDELMHCRGLLKEAMEDKSALEDENEALSDEFMILEKENERLKNELNRLANQLTEYEANDKKQDKTEAEQIDGQTLSHEELDQKIITLENRILNLENELCAAQSENEKLINRVAENRRELEESTRKTKDEKQALKEEIKQLENELNLSQNSKTMLIEAENNLKQSELNVYNLEKEKSSLEKQMAEIGEKLLNERAKGKQDRIRLEDEVERVKFVLNANQEELRKLRSIQIEKQKVDDELNEVTKNRDELKQQLSEVSENVKKNKESFKVERRKFETEILDLNTKNRTFSETRDGLIETKNELERTKKDYAQVLKEKERVKNELSNLQSQFNKEKTWLINEKEDLEKYVEHLEERIENLQSVQQELKKSNADVESLKKHVDGLEDEKRSLECSLEKEMSRHSEDKSLLEEKLKSSNEEIEGYKQKANLVSLREEKIKENEFKVRKLEQSLSDTIKDKFDSKKELEERLKSEVSLFRVEQDRLHDEIKELKNELKVKDDERQEKVYLKSILEQERANFTKLDADNRLVRQQCANFESLVTSLRKDKSAAQTELVKIKSEKMKLKSDLDKVTQRLRTAMDDYDITLKENETIKGEISVLKDDLYRERDEGLKAVASVDTASMQQSAPNGNEQFCKSCAELQTKLRQFEKVKADDDEYLENPRKVAAVSHTSRPKSSSVESNTFNHRSEGTKTETFDERFRSTNEYSVSQNTAIINLKEENSKLRRQLDTAQDSLEKAHNETKVTLDRVRNMEESNANMTRSLKARKNELQMQLTKTQHEKEVIEKEARILRDQISNLQAAELSAKDNAAMRDEITELRKKLSEADEQTRAANLKAAETELQNRECTRKLHESEILILDLQRAVARANDVAMEKALESSRNKRLLEKKFERVLKENTNLRKHFFFDGPTMVEAENNRTRSKSDISLQSPPSNEVSDKWKDRFDVMINSNHHPASESQAKNRRKQSIDELQSSAVQNKDASLSRSGSAPLGKRFSINNQLVKTTVTARSVSPPVKYVSDTESVGSKPDSSDGDNIQGPSPPRKPAPPSYYETKRSEKERQSLPQPEKVHRPILLKEIPFPNLSPANQRRSRPTSPNVKQIKANNGKERMEHWV